MNNYTANQTIAITNIIVWLIHIIKQNNKRIDWLRGIVTKLIYLAYLQWINHIISTVLDIKCIIENQQYLLIGYFISVTICNGLDVFQVCNIYKNSLFDMIIIVLILWLIG